MNAIGRKILHLSRRPEARHVGILASGSLIAQVGLIAISPVLSRLFAPASYGVFSLMLTISTIGGAIGGLCYEVAIILPRSQRMATALYRLAFVLSIVISGVTVCIVALVQYFFPHLLGRTLPANFYYYCFAAMALTAQINALCYAHSRALQYGAVSMNRIMITVLPGIMQIALALIGMAGEGLMLGRVLGLLGSEWLLTRRLPRGFRLSELADTRMAPVITAARSYRDFLVQVPRQLLVRGATMLPAALMLGAYGPTVAGLYFFAQRLVERPGMLLGDTLTRVPMKQFADRVQQRRPLTRAALLYTAIVSSPVILGVVAMALTAHPIFRVVFGLRWEPAADYAVALAWWAAVRLGSLPMATLTTALRVQKLSFYVDALFAARVIVIPLMASRHASALAAVTAFCGLSILYHLVIVAVGLFSALRYDRSLKPVPQPQAFDVVRTGETYG